MYVCTGGAAKGRELRKHVCLRECIHLFMYIYIWLQVAVQVARKGANSCIDIHGSVICIYIYKKKLFTGGSAKGRKLKRPDVYLRPMMGKVTRVAVCCSVLQYDAVRCSVLQYVAVCYNVLQSWRVFLSYDGQGYTSPAMCCSVW